MLGKRSRSMRRIASGMSMGLECPLVETLPPAEPVREKHTSLRFGSPCPPQIIIGFCPKACPEKEEDDQKSLPETTASGKQSASPESRPRSGLESLRSSPRPSEEKNLQTAFMGLKAAPLSPDPALLRGDVSGKTDVTECGLKWYSGMSVHCHPLPFSELKQMQSCGFVNTLKQSHPIQIDQSPLNKSTGQSNVQQQSPAECRHDRQSESSSLLSARKFSRDCAHDGEEPVERCIFSLQPTSPGTYEDTYSIISFESMDFMEACFLCKRRLGQGHDIFMYKGDKAFCSDECRYHQIVIDEHAESREKYSSVALKAGTAVQSSRNNHKTSLLSASTAAAA